MFEAYSLENTPNPDFSTPLPLSPSFASLRTNLKTKPYLFPSPLSLTPAVTASTLPLHSDLVCFVERIYGAAQSELVRRIETPPNSLTDIQIERGETKLREIRFAIASQQRDRLVSLTGEYFSLLPHRFEPPNGQSVSKDNVIDTVKKADEEEDLLQLMRDVFNVQGDLTADVDCKYQALGAKISVLDSTSSDYDRIERKIHVSHSWRHDFKLCVRRIFAVHLPAERARFHFDQEGEALGNVQELFHGAHSCNVVGILSRGLLISPRNAPCAGAMFGKGIYFADQSSKSAQYRKSAPAQSSHQLSSQLSSSQLSSSQLSQFNARPDSGYIFLADVALGRIKRERLACYRENAPDGYDSVQGCKGAYLDFNEFIVYRASQCTLRYIAEIEFS